MALTQQSVQVSAPGKVLITGGYLVLDQQHPGLVLATTARFHTKIEVLTHAGKIDAMRVCSLVCLQ